jgi:hypothetical protein
MEKLHNGELHNLFLSPDIIRQSKLRRMRWAGHVECMGEERKAYKVAVRKPEGKRPLKRPKHKWEDGTQMDVNEIGWEGVECIDLAQDRDQWQASVNTVMNLQVMAQQS